MSVLRRFHWFISLMLVTNSLIACGNPVDSAFLNAEIRKALLEDGR